MEAGFSLKVFAGIFNILVKLVYVVIVISMLIASPLILGYKPVVVMSPSMEPEYPVGSMTYFKAVDVNEIDVDDAITINMSDGSLVTHRVVEKNDEAQTFTTKGDNNPSQDRAPVPFDSVMGKTMDFALPYAGFVAKYVQEKWIIIVGLGMILLIDILTSTPTKAKKTAGKIDIRAMAGVEREAQPPTDKAPVQELPKRGERQLPRNWK